MNKPSFISDQQWSLLIDFENPKKWIDAITARARQVPGANMQTAEPGPWIPVKNRTDVVRNLVKLPDGSRVDLKRFVFTTDSGLGKSCALDRIQTQLNREKIKRVLATCRNGGEPIEQLTGGWLAFNVPRRVLSEGSVTEVHDRLLKHMEDKVHDAAAGRGYDERGVRQTVEQQLRANRLLLLFDGLDHLNNVDALCEVLTSNRWRDCHIGIGARPFALNRYWDQLFKDPDWRFIKVEPFTVSQQKTYLGDKYDAVKESARHLLSVPRVIKYIFELPRDEIEKLNTAADVYYGAIKHQIKWGLKGSPKAREIGSDTGDPPEDASDTGIEKTFHLLSAIAFDMVNNQVEQAIKRDGETIGHRKTPNFEKVSKGKMPEFKERIQKLTKRENFDRAWNALAAINNGVLNGIFDDDTDGLTEVQFSNRSLQEFLCAYYLAQYCGREDSVGEDGKKNVGQGSGRGIEKGANDFLWDWIYLPFEPETHDYYEIWGYLCEMHTDAINPDVWLESIAPLYSPARQKLPEAAVSQPATTSTTTSTSATSSASTEPRWVTKRSNEMIFRSWSRLESCIETSSRALEIRDQWWSEFENEILSGNRGDDSQQIAIAFTNDFLRFPHDKDSDKFWMGIPDEKRGGIPDEIREYWEYLIQRAEEIDDKHGLIERVIDGFDFGVGPDAEFRKNALRIIVRRVLIDGGGMRLVEQLYEFGKDEHWHEITISEPFWLCRRPCTNAMYRLYSIGHGSETLVAESYREYCKQDDTPAIYISFFDAWAYCQWARWENTSCQLPFEDQWEYACKYGTDPEWFYWWESDEFDSTKANGNGETTLPADSSRANPKTIEIDPAGQGLMDMLANVVEWCQDLYQEPHSQSRESNQDAHRFRVVRGGSFGIVDLDCRSAVRNYGPPAFTIHVFGFRVSRAKLTSSSLPSSPS